MHFKTKEYRLILFINKLVEWISRNVKSSDLSRGLISNLSDMKNQIYEQESRGK